ncbi:CLUMA_CG021134, isoform A [Clunio marinus]|uniref:CLUMA_CG021134, isoform A n=1 Tax=Clunio marinus TaxID=568069 RepID=A0A1J1J661_9DIPT|nr:CLUMA_CG021134, isoform A [Clunio marinus]
MFLKKNYFLNSKHFLKAKEKRSQKKRSFSLMVAKRETQRMGDTRGFVFVNALLEIYVRIAKLRYSHNCRSLLAAFHDLIHGLQQSN